MNTTKSQRCELLRRSVVVVIKIKIWKTELQEK